MKTRILLVLAMVLVLVVAGSASVAAKGATVPFRSTLATTPVVNGGGSGYFTLAIPGEGRSTHLGRTTWYADCTVYLPAPDPPLVQICTMTFYAANGDELYGETDGYAQQWHGRHVLGRFHHHGRHRSLCELHRQRHVRGNGE